jgi:hypothetical protein
MSMRDDFEAWWMDKEYLRGGNLSTGEYFHLPTQAAWAAWQAAQPKWLPIEGAPKDGTPILITGGVFDWDDSWNEASNWPDFEGVTTAAWDDSTSTFTYFNGQGHNSESYHKPTLYMLRPEAPK